MNQRFTISPCIPMIFAAVLGLAAPASAAEAAIPSASAPADEAFAQWGLRPAQEDPATEADTAARTAPPSGEPAKPSRFALR